MIRSTRIGFAFACTFIALWMAGCSSGTSEGNVTAVVTVDGQPLKEGSISFVPVDGKSSTAGGSITDGKFTGKVPLGEMKVQIRAKKVIGKKKMYDTPDSPVVEEVEELLDEKYNDKTELTMTVAAGDQTKTFEVKAKAEK